MWRSYIQVMWVGVWSMSVPLGAQEPDAYKEEMERWEAEEKRHAAEVFKIQFDRYRAHEALIHIEEPVLLKHPAYTLEVLASYEHDSDASVRSVCGSYAWLVGVAHRPADPIRKEVVRQLVNKCFDPEALVWQEAARLLVDFDEQDFTSDVVKTLGDNVTKEPIRDDVLLVVGVANLFILDNWLKSISDNHFFALLGLARLGDDEAARRAVGYVEEKGTSSGISSTLLARLAYTRHPVALDYLAVYLNRDDGGITPKESGDYYRPPYSRATLHALAKHWPDFPVKKMSNPRKYTDTDLQLAREWVRKKLRERQP